jgi:hypothetical protein
MFQADPYPVVFKRKLTTIDFEELKAFGPLEDEDEFCPPERDFFIDFLLLGQAHEVSQMRFSWAGMAVRFNEGPTLSGRISLCPNCPQGLVVDGVAVDLTPIPDDQTATGDDDCFE